ncbi:hypothetical protein BDD12DRAFT_877267 [Trichophaea hybrida]|nr:hypothetical protein BDD12DRAFT_877267 [Trichophaea hybrida]
MAEGTVKTEDANIYRTYCNPKELFVDNEQDVPTLATHLWSLLDEFKNHTGAWDAMAKHCLYPENDGEGVEEE